ncbi:GTPase HflX [Bacillus carboniphilus]|uniref:GTPase HflX n=1 Tax=Bacillus carboniphilus TaxID=86663 RepID=A0ABP3G8F2_9BACI
MVQEYKEKAILVGCQLPHIEDERFTFLMEELASLTHTANGEVLAEVVQKRDRIDNATYIGKGKLEELKALEEELEPSLFIFNDELSPSQVRNISAHLDAKIIDRTQLILDIFAGRAKSREGKLQVELAQLEYLLPRLGGQGAQLSRLGGGIGTRGPGETKLESDRRHINRRIDELKRQFEQVKRHRERYRERRKRNQVFQIALVGYTNAGKSTIFNRLTSEETLEENLLFATLDPTTRKVKLPTGFQSLITDTVGFIQHLPTTLVAAFRSTLEEVAEADLLIHVVDSSHPDCDQHERTVRKLLESLEASSIPEIVVYNKRDASPRDFVRLSPKNSIHISAYKEEDLRLLLQTVESVIRTEMNPYDLLIQADQGRMISQLKTETIVTNLEFDEQEDVYRLKGYALETHPIFTQQER